MTLQPLLAKPAIVNALPSYPSQDQEDLLNLNTKQCLIDVFLLNCSPQTSSSAT